MKYFITTILLAITLTLSGCEACGNSSTNSKKVHRNTPLICDDYASADVSLGVLRNGYGSVSAHDVTVVLPSDAVDVAYRAAGSRPVHASDDRRTWPRYLWPTTVARIDRARQKLAEIARKRD